MASLHHIVLGSVAGLALTLGAIGCQPERPDVIPSGAQLNLSGDKALHATAPADGKAYVYDTNSMRLIWSGDMIRGASVDVDPVKNQVAMNGSVVNQKGLVPGHQVDIYFMPFPSPAPAPAYYPPPQPSPSTNGVTVTPSVTVQPSDGVTTPPGSVTVQPNVNVTPARP